jgi:hypothetical protein
METIWAPGWDEHLQAYSLWSMLSIYSLPLRSGSPVISQGLAHAGDVAGAGGRFFCVHGAVGEGVSLVIIGSMRDNRTVPLRTALDDLQAQLEAGDRTLARINHEVDDLDRAFDESIRQADLVGRLRRRLKELRAHLQEQRATLREAGNQARVVRDLVRRTRAAATGEEQPVVEGASTNGVAAAEDNPDG